MRSSAIVPGAFNAGEDVRDDMERARARAAARARRRLISVVAIQTVSLAVVLGVWQLVGTHTSPALFAPPSAVLLAAVDMIGSGELWKYLAPSLLVLAIGLAISVVLGVGVGVTLARFWVVDIAVGPYVTFLYSTPAVALVPLIVLWAGYELEAKVIILVLFAFFPMAINTYQGVKNVDEKLLEVGKAFRCSERQLWTHIVLPGALPFIIAGLRLSVGRGLIGMVLADLYTAISGIGFLIVRSASTYRVDRMFVPIVTLGMLGILLTTFVTWVERRVVPWTRASERNSR
jgi:NitT/TauT family transport system permease protein